MPSPSDPKERAIYHTILSDLHRARAAMLNLQTLKDPSTEAGLRDHFQREQTLALGRLAEWKQHRPGIYKDASDDFRSDAGDAQG